MRAITVDEFGDTDVLALHDVPDPTPGADQVSIDVSHASVTLADVLMRQGVFGGTTPLVPGLEVAGTVREIGDGVSDLAPGDAVVTLSRPTGGGYAEISRAAAAVTVPIGDLDPAQALVSVPNTATALAALESVAHLQPGERVVVLGGLGALGAVLGRVARAVGAGQVDTVVRRDAQRERAADQDWDHVLLADQVVTDPAGAREQHTDGAGWDVVLDPVGGALRRVALDLLAPLGRIVVVGDASGDDTTFAGDDLWARNASVAGFGAGPMWIAAPELARRCGRRAVDLVRADPGDVAIDIVPLADAADAHRRLEAGDVRSRIVLAP